MSAAEFILTVVTHPNGIETMLAISDTPGSVASSPVGLWAWNQSPHQCVLKVQHTIEGMTSCYFSLEKCYFSIKKSYVLKPEGVLPQHLCTLLLLTHGLPYSLPSLKTSHQFIDTALQCCIFNLFLNLQCIHAAEL